jgi:hypothetical protein
MGFILKEAPGDFKEFRRRPLTFLPEAAITLSRQRLPPSLSISRLFFPQLAKTSARKTSNETTILFIKERSPFGV